MVSGTSGSRWQHTLRQLQRRWWLGRILHYSLLALVGLPEVCDCEFQKTKEEIARDIQMQLDNASCTFAQGVNEGKTNMFKALEPTMKAEASTRRALEKCISELGIGLAFDYFDCLMI